MPAVAMLNTTTTRTNGPVSYTHLDVYKRQVPGEREPNALFRAAAEVPERMLVNTLTGLRIARTLSLIHI